MKKILSLVVLFILLSVLGCQAKSTTTIHDNQTEKDYPIKLITSYDGKNQITIDPNINRYIKNADNTAYLAETLYSRSIEMKENGRSRYDYQFINIEWEDTNVNETYTVHVADNIDFINEFTYSTTGTKVDKEIGIFIPGTKYYYKVTGSVSGESKIDSFVASARVRYISADTCVNVRDIGGWETKDGKTINYSLLYRGAALNEYPNASYLSEQGKKVFEYLGIKGEIDLRGNDLVDCEKSRNDNFINKINPNYPILREGLYYFVPEQIVSDKGRAENNLPKIFEFLANKDNYPIYYHCSVGADRTGLLSYLIEGLLGVEYKYLCVDYELTSFSTDTVGGIRSRSIISKDGDAYKFNTPSVDDLSILGRLGYANDMLLKEYQSYSTDLQKVIEKYLLDSGVRKEHIDSFKSIMLD